MVLSIWLMWLYGYSKRTEFTLGLWQANLSLLGRELYVSIFVLKSLVPWKGMRPIFHHAASIIISLNCCQFHTQNTFLFGMELRSSLIFEMIWIGTVDLYIYGRVGPVLVHSDHERYYQSFCWGKGQSQLKNVLLTCQHLLL